MSARQDGHDTGCTSESGSHLVAVWGTSAGLRSGLGKSQSSKPMIVGYESRGTFDLGRECPWAADHIEYFESEQHGQESTVRRLLLHSAIMQTERTAHYGPVTDGRRTFQSVQLGLRGARFTPRTARRFLRCFSAVKTHALWHFLGTDSWAYEAFKS
jgi:hypothetical protein